MARYSYRYLVSKPGRQGSTRWYWQPKKGLREFGWEPQRLRPDLTFPASKQGSTHPPEAVLAEWRRLDAQLGGVYLGQREGDLLDLLRVQRQGGPDRQRRVHLRQSKRHAHVSVREHPRLTARWDQAEIRAREINPKAKHLILCELTGRPWRADHFRHKYAEVRALASDPKRFSNTFPEAADLAPCPSVADAWFMDTRDTAVTKLATAGCTIPELCAITGHSERSAMSVLKHYHPLNGDMANAAIQKLINWKEAQLAAAEQARETE